MSSTLASRPAVRRSPAARRHAQRRPPSAHELRSLARYADREGNAREVVTRAGLHGSVLVVDRDTLSHSDCRLLAHLAADEPAENAVLICSLYLDHLRREPVHPRRLTIEDLNTAAAGDHDPLDPAAIAAALAQPPVDAGGTEYRLVARGQGASIPELRWSQLSSVCAGREQEQIVSLRQAVGALESYEPVCTRTRLALAGCAQRRTPISTAVLRGELSRVELSPIVLNRRLREVTLAAIEREGVTLSEIATRCGRIKRDADCNKSGETSWLSRRLGLMPEGGKAAPTPWIHTDVLALIARRGLGVSPREVEAG
jgi:hypothetical protein